MERNLSLLTDLYELTMMNGYYLNDRRDEVAVFDVFFRQNHLITYSVAAGLEQVCDYLINLKFSADELAYLKGLNLFDDGFLEYLKNFKFTGDVYAVPEGTFVFPGEPILTVKAPVMQAQLVETAILNLINHQTLIATKSAKICYAAQGDSVMEFGLRRAQGPDAGVFGARAAIIGGCSSTSNVLTGKMFGVPVSGTHAHSWVMNFPTELEAFRAYAKVYPDATMLLVDTYDVIRSGIPNAIKVFDELVAAGHKPVGIRIDSGDLAYLTKKARKMLDDAGYTYAKICASGDLDERSITSLKLQGAKIDLWGVGTKLITSEDMPALGGVYKLSAVFDGDRVIPKIKISETSVKITNPGFKTVYRIYDQAGMAQADIIALREEQFDTSRDLTICHPVDRWKKTTFAAGEYTLKEIVRKVVSNGELAENLPLSLKDVRAYADKEKATFWDEYKRIDNPHVYKVDLSDGLYKLKTDMINEIRRG